MNYAILYILVALWLLSVIAYVKSVGFFNRLFFKYIPLIFALVFTILAFDIWGIV